MAPTTRVVSRVGRQVRRVWERGDLVGFGNLSFFSFLIFYEMALILIAGAVKHKPLVVKFGNV